TNITNFSARLGEGGIQHTLSAGVEITREKSSADRIGTVNPVPTDLFNPDPNRAVGAFPVPSQVNHIDVDTLAFYFYDTIEFSEQFEITAGIRAEDYDVELDSQDLLGNPIDDI